MNHTKLKFKIDWDEDALHPADRNNRIECIDPISGLSIQIADHVNGGYADFIVRACNAHDALVELAQSVAQHFEYISTSPLGAQAIAALKLAGE